MTARKGNTDLNFIINKLQGFAASGNFANVDLAYIWQLIGGGGGGTPDHYLGDTNLNFPGSFVIDATKKTIPLSICAIQNVSSQNIILTGPSNNCFEVDQSGNYIFDISISLGSVTSTIKPGAITLYITSYDMGTIAIRVPVIPSTLSNGGNYWGSCLFNFHCELIGKEIYKIEVHTDTLSGTVSSQRIYQYFEGFSNYATPENLSFSLSIFKID